MQFDEPLDHAQLPRFIKLYRDDKQIDAEVDTGRENRLLLKPKTPWQNGDYQLRVHPRLEDLAGNTPERVFDRDLAAPAAGKNDPVRAFRIRLD